MRKADMNTGDILYWKGHYTGQHPAKLVDLELTALSTVQRKIDGVWKNEQSWRRATWKNARAGRETDSYGGNRRHTGYPILYVDLGTRSTPEHAAAFAEALEWLREADYTFEQLTDPNSSVKLPTGVKLTIATPVELLGTWDAVQAEKEADRQAELDWRERKRQAEREAQDRYAQICQAAQALGVALPATLPENRLGQQVVTVPLDTLDALFKLIGS